MLLQLLEDFVLQTPTGSLPLDPTGGLPPPDSPGPAPHHVNPLYCKILGTPMVEVVKVW